MGMFVGLGIQAHEAGFEHGGSRLIKFCAFYWKDAFFPNIGRSTAGSTAVPLNSSLHRPI